jgi:sterol desaturase/sphingolipid hydroxylase (fatty acid hydroxylase superfamily)
LTPSGRRRYHRSMIEQLAAWLDLRSFVQLALIYGPLEWLFPLHRGQKTFRRLWWNDLLYWVFNRFLILGGIVGMLAVIRLALDPLVPEVVRTTIGSLPLVVQLVLATLLCEVGFYTLHRAHHRVPILWQFHAVHHSMQELDWLASVRIHAMDQILTKTAQILPLFVLGFSDRAIEIWGFVFFLQAHFEHTNFRVKLGPLRWLVSGPEFHHWHHSSDPEAFDSNFAGQLPFVDWLMGTAYMPRGRMPTAYGISDPVPELYFAQVVYPFRRVYHLVRGRLGG